MIGVKRWAWGIVLLSGGILPAPEASAADAGVNLEPNVDYAVSRTWTDVRCYFRIWGQVGSPWTTGNISLNSDAYPLQDAEALTFMKGYPSGVYKLSYDGTGTVTVVGGTTSNKVTSGGRTTADVNIVRNATLDNMISIRITGIDRANPVRNLRLITPGYAADGSQPFTNEFLKRARPFKCFRFMDWMQTNNSPVVNWADRAPAGSFQQCSPKGVSYENMIALCNAAGRDMWVCIPDQASDDYVRQFARLIRDRLNPSLKVYVEYSNELWNGMFSQYGRVRNAARANGALTKSDDFGRVGEQAAFRLKQISDIFRTEFGASASRVRPVLAGQYVNTYFLQSGLTFLQSRYGNPSSWLAGIAIAPYVGGSLGAADTTGLTLDTLFSIMNADLDGGVTNGIRSHKSLANQYGLPLLAYEGGQHLTAHSSYYGGDRNEALKVQANGDRRMGQLIRRLMDKWNAEGGGLFAYFDHIGPWNKWGCWGLLPDNMVAGGPKWDNMMAAILPGGDATLDGTVGYPDFQVFKANYGGTGKFWEQGDFNHDGRVDKADWAMFRPNLTGLNATQLAEVAAFEASIGVSTGTGGPPTVQISSPTNGAGFLAGSTVTVTANATAAAGSTLSKVEFYNGATKLGEDSVTPYTYAWSGVAAGSYSLTARAVDSAGRTTTSAPVGITVNASGPAPGNGTGLTGTYFDNPDLTAQKVTRTDATVNFTWASGVAPATGMIGDTYSVRWTGQILPLFSGSHTFTTNSDDGVRLWVNGQLIVNNWTNHGPTDNTGSISLTAGQKVDVKMEFYNAYGGASAKLYWQSASQPRQIIPQQQLFPAPATTPPPPATTAYEGESANNTLAGGAIARTVSGASGGRVIGSMGKAGSSIAGSVTFNRVNVPTTGSYKLTINYISRDNRSLHISRNGGPATVVAVPNTADWSTVGTLTLTVTLNAGDNTLKFFNDASGAPDIDRIVVQAAP